MTCTAGALTEHNKQRAELCLRLERTFRCVFILLVYLDAVMASAGHMSAKEMRH